MLVEDAERYGISQLHQLRGRIGRGEHASLCLLFGPEESPRLRALAEPRDGFKLAEIDLELRGEGEMLGTRQSGSPSSGSRGCRTTPSCSSAPACRRAHAARRRPRAARARARAARGRASRPPTARTRSSRSPRNNGSATLARMSLSCPRRAVAALLVALSACAVVPAAASAKKQDLKVMTRNLYLGADIIPLAAAQDEASFEQAAAQRFQTVQNNNFPARAKLVAAEIKKAKPDLVGLQEATTWRRGPDGVKDGPATPATQVVYDSTKELLKALKQAKAPYKVVVKRDWFDFEAPTALGYDVRITQTDVILARKGSKVKLGKSFKGGYKNHFDPPTVRGVAPELRGWVGVDATLAKHKFRFVSTHLEAYSADIANKQMQELLTGYGPLSSKKRASILVGDFNSPAEPTRTRTPTSRRSRPASPTRSRSAARAASLRTCTARPTTSTSGSTTSSCGRRSRRSSRASSAPSRSAASSPPTTRGSPPRCA